MDTKEALNENFRKFMKDGPRLRYDYNTPVLAVCDCGWVFLGGLGGLGVGQMWLEGDERFKDYIGYDEAERVKHRGSHRLIIRVSK